MQGSYGDHVVVWQLRLGSVVNRLKELAAELKQEASFLVSFSTKAAALGEE